LFARIYFLGLIAVFSITAQCQITFRKPDFDTGKAPLALAAADFNGDGRPDVATANSQGNSVSILLNDGHGGFLPHSDYPAGNFPVALVAGDFNNDGFPDLAVANENSNSISVLLGNGNGSFRSGGTFASGTRPMALVSGDFNRDGKLDLAVVNRGDHTVSVYLGSGNGSFTHNADYVTSRTIDDAFQSGALAVDLNRDGILDLVVVDDMAQAFIFLGKGDGTFIQAANLSSTFPMVAGPIAAADLNQDGNLDLVMQGVGCARGCSGNILIFAGHGDGTFDAATNTILEGDGVPLAVVDVNGDGVPDLIAGSFVVPVQPARIFNPNIAPHLLPLAPAGLGVQAFVSADFDADGKPDIVTANWQDNTISLLLGDGTGGFHQPLRYPAGINPQAIVAGDFNRDGVPDLAIGNEIVLGIQIFFGDGNGGLRAPAMIATDMDVSQLAVADLNGDGIPDLLATGLINSSPVMRFLPGRGDGTFGAPVDRPVLTDVFGALAVADFNGDGTLDVATIGGSLSSPGMFLHIYFNNGDGSFRDPIDTPLGFQAGGIAVADFNRDGKMDVVLGRNNNAVIGNGAVFLGNGDGTFQNSANFTASGSLATADFNHDGIMDFVALPDLFLGNGDGTFRQLKGVFNRNVFDSASGFPHVADMNGDGIPDVVIAEDDHLTVFLNNGDGSVQFPVVLTAGGAWDVAIADFNSDGRPDIAAVGAALNTALSLLLNTGSSTSPGSDFALALRSQTMTVTSGQQGSTSILVSAVGTFQDQVTFSCAGLPALASCTFSPAAVALSQGGSVTSTLTITTQPAATAQVLRGRHATALLALGMPVLGLLLAGRRTQQSMNLWAVTALLLLCACIFAGCGSVNKSQVSSVGTPRGTYTITVQATSSGSPAVTHSQTLVLNVQ
jgi:hypothetical protein